MADEAKRIHVSRGVRPAASTARPRGKSHRPLDERHTASRARGLRVRGRVAPKRRPQCASVGSNTRSAGWNAILRSVVRVSRYTFACRICFSLCASHIRARMCDGTPRRLRTRRVPLAPTAHIYAPAALTRNTRPLWVPTKYGQTRVGACAGMAGQSIGGTHG